MAGKTREKAITNEQVVAALVTNATVKDAAAAVGLSSRAIYDRMQTSEFSKLYTAAKLDILRVASNAVNYRLISAVETVARIMNNEYAPDGVRLQAAQYIVNSAVKISNALVVAEGSAADNQGKMLLAADQIDAEVNRRVEQNMRGVMSMLLKVMTPEQADQLMKYTFGEMRRQQNSGE